jgi:flagellar L-ring protein precursor FlgH
MQKLIFIILLMAAFSMSGCAAPKRGDAAYAPVMPVYVQGPQQNNDSIYQPGTAWLLHEDLKARRVGDMLTVLLQEQTDAQKTSATDSTKTTSVSMTDPTILGTSAIKNGNAIFDNQLDSDHSFSGKGDTSQSNSLTGSVTVVVVEVLSNGNLVVQGEKWLNINEGEDFVRLRGIVRQIDISPDNTIASVRVANADIQYGGTGSLGSANKQGWLARFFSSEWMPF